MWTFHYAANQTHPHSNLESSIKSFPCNNIVLITSGFQLLVNLWCGHSIMLHMKSTPYNQSITLTHQTTTTNTLLTKPPHPLPLFTRAYLRIPNNHMITSLAAEKEREWEREGKHEIKFIVLGYVTCMISDHELTNFCALFAVASVLLRWLRPSYVGCSKTQAIVKTVQKK